MSDAAEAIRVAEDLLQRVTTEDITDQPGFSGSVGEPSAEPYEGLDLADIQKLTEFVKLLPERWEEIRQKPQSPGIILDRSAHEDFRQLISRGCQVIPQLQSAIDLVEFTSKMDVKKLEKQIEQMSLQLDGLRKMESSRMSVDDMVQLKAELYSSITLDQFDL